MRALVLVQLTVMFGFSIAFEPITTGLVLGASAFLTGSGYTYYDKIRRYTYCKRFECCMDELIPHDILKLKEMLASRLYGQHIAEEKVFQAVASHYKELEKSKKPLVMVFLGTPGTGKNFVSNMIAEAVFKKGTSSKFFHVFHGSQYIDESRLNEYQEQIKDEIYKAIGDCGYSIFVFDEIDKMPGGIFDTITAMLDHHTLVKGKDFRRAVFIFLTNYGGAKITKILHQLTARDAFYRHDTKLHHFEEACKIEVYNKEGGLKESPVIKSAVIDFYIPFLPLEEKHIIQCIRTEFKNYGRATATEEMIEEILHYISFNDITRYADAGCKSIHPKVRAQCL